MAVSTKYCIIGDTTVEIATTVVGGDTTTEVNVLLPNSAAGASMEAPAALEAPVVDVVPVAAVEAPVEVSVEEPPVAAQPLWGTFDGPTQPPLATAVVPPKKLRGLQAVIRGMYTVLFTLLGMAGAAFAALRDNLTQLTDLKWTTILIVVGGALLAGLGYGLKRYVKPEGLL